MGKIFSRRKFFGNTLFSAAGIMLGGRFGEDSPEYGERIESYDIMKDVMKYRKFDAHCHVGLYGPLPDDADRQIDSADRLGIEWLSISNPITRREAEVRPEEARERNDVIYKAMKLYPDRFVGFFTLNPLYQKESLEEIRRCADLGFAGYKGYIQVKVNDKLYYPIIEQLISYNMICFMHAECEPGIGGYRMKYDVKTRPNATIPEDMVEAARRYPEAMFQWAHIASGDFEYICKMIKNYSNIYVDVSGSNNDEKHVDFCIEQLGEDRIFFGSDNSYYQAVGKILASDATEDQKRKIFFDNYNNMLKKGPHNVD
jgi:uncharacterized protein